ncbi:MAG TPA: hypothetical protein VM657_10230 [Sphingomonas sp.]|nr:hypothetical protein [Sphingomonas sp.]
MAGEIAGVRTIVESRVEDAKFSADGSQLITANGQAIDVYDVASGALVAHYDVGTDLGAIDVSADSRYVAAIERDAVENADGTADYAVHRLDLQTGTVETFVAHLDGFYAPFADVAFAADGTLLISRATYSGPLFTLDPDTGVFAETDQSFGRGAVLASTGDHGLVLADPSAPGDTPLYIVDPATGERTEYHDYYDPYAGASVRFHDVPASAISPDGRFVIQGYKLQVYDAQLDPVVTLADRYPYLAPTDTASATMAGLAFSPDGERLYLLDAAAQRVIGFDTATWEAVITYPIGTDVVGINDNFNGFLRNDYGDSIGVSADGRYLSVLGGAAVTIIDLDTVAPDGGTAGDDVISGAGAMYGFAGADDLTATGEAVLYGGEDDDTYHISAEFETAIELAGEGHDTVVSSVSYAIGDNIEDLEISADGGAGVGNALGNRLTGAAGAQTLAGLGGNDTIAGDAGDDVLVGGAGADRIDGGDGNDRLYSAGDAYLPNLDYPGADVGVPDDGDPDRGNEHDVLAGGAGDDFLSAGYGDDVDGGGGSDDLALSLIGAASGASIDTTQLVGGGVTIGGGTIANVERVTAVWGSDADDDLDASGQAGAIHLDGRLGDDRLAGGAGDDTIEGGAGADRVTGGAGDDTFVIRAGDVVAGDAIAGDGGFDTVSIVDAAYVDLSPAALSGIESVRTGDAAVVAMTLAQADGLSQIAGGTMALTTGGTIAFDGVTLDLGAINLADTATSISLAGATTSGLAVNGGAGADTIVGSDGADSLAGGAGADHVSGGAGDDIVRIGDGDAAVGDTIDGGAGHDAIHVTAYDAIDLSATAIANVEDFVGGTATATLTRAQLASFGLIHGDVAVADGGALDFTGIDLDGTLRLSADGNIVDLRGAIGAIDVIGMDGDDTIIGGAADDFLVGGGGADTLDGGMGNDVLVGSAGDTLTGGAGADLFYFDTPFDGATITDFDFYDVIEIAGSDSLPLTRFAGEGAFTGIAGEGRYEIDGDVLRIEVDLDGDRTADNILTVYGASQGLTVTAGENGTLGLRQSEDDGDYLLIAPDGAAVTVGSSGHVIGTDGVQDVTVLSGSSTHVTFDPSFNAGGDRIHLAGSAADYVAVRDGSMLVLDNGLTAIAVPVGAHGADIVFDDGTRSISADIANNQVLLGDQVVGTSAAPVLAPPQTPGATGAIDPDAGGLLVVAAGADVVAGGNLFVFGTDQDEHVTVVGGGSVRFDPSFNQGGDTIALTGTADTYLAVRDGSTLVLSAGDDQIAIPIGYAATTVSFDGDARALVYDADSGTVMLGDQAIGTTAEPLDPAAFALADHDVALPAALPPIEPAALAVDPGALVV